VTSRDALRRDPQGETYMPRSIILSSIVASSFAAALLLASPQAMAQGQPAAPADFSQQQIESFVDAAVEVQRVKTDLDAQTQGVTGQEDIVRLHQEAEQQAIQAVEDSGLSPTEYTAIIQAASEDPQLYAMIVDLMQKRSTQ
jgi:hypothetical protein